MSDQSVTMDFFGAQDRAKANTFKLVFLFSAAVISLCLGMFIVIDVAYVFATKDTEEYGVKLQDFFNWDILAYSVLGTMMVIGLATMFKVASLSGGGEKVATMLGGEKINPSTRDPHERRVLNVVEEMSIASGVPTPDVYMMPEDSINAFAAGTQIENAVIGVTRGCVRLLTRDELQGVIAHEFSHILNQDMRMNIKLMGVVFGIMVIAIIGRYLLEISARMGSGGGDGKKSALPLILVGLSIFIMGSAGLFFSRWIKGSISRQREYLADASAVQFTRNPDGIAGALKKIGGLVHGSQVKSTAAEEASHMFFGNIFKSNFLFATHPPLTDRIARIDPKFDGRFPEVSETAAFTGSEAAAKPKVERVEKRKGPGADNPVPIPIPGMPGIPGAGNTAIPGGVIIGSAILDEEERQRMAKSAESADTSVGNPNRLQLDYASQLHDEVPEELINAIHEPLTALATIFALLLDLNEEKTRKDQLDIIAQYGPKGAAGESAHIFDILTTLDHRFYLPLAEIAAPALRDLSNNQYLNFKKICRQLIEEDQSIDLFEYTIDKMIESTLDVHFGLAKKKTIQYYSPSGVNRQIDIILSCLAYQGHHTQEEAENAFMKGKSVFQGKQGMSSSSLLDKKECHLVEVDKAIDMINTCSAPVKKMIVQAVGKTVAADGEITRVEGDLMRSVCYGFGCPVPPFVG